MHLAKLKTTNVHEIDVNELPDHKPIGKLLLEQTIKYPMEQNISLQKRHW